MEVDEIKGNLSQLFEANPKLESRQLISQMPSGLENLDLSDLDFKSTGKLLSSSSENDNSASFMKLERYFVLCADGMA